MQKNNSFTQSFNFSFFKSLLTLVFWSTFLAYGIAQGALASNDTFTTYPEIAAPTEAPKKDTLHNTLPTTMISRSPFFSAGNEAMQAYFAKAIQYTENAKKNCKEGMVQVKVLVSPTGELKDPTIIDPIDAELEVQVLQAIQAMPNWEPALQNGRAVKCKMIIPIKFSLR